MKNFNLYIISFAICLIITYIIHTISSSFEAGGVAGILCMSIFRYVDEKTKGE